MTDETPQNAEETQVSETVTDIVGSSARHVIIPLKKTGGGKQ